MVDTGPQPSDWAIWVACSLAGPLMLCLSGLVRCGHLPSTAELGIAGGGLPQPPPQLRRETTCPSHASGSVPGRPLGRLRSCMVQPFQPPAKRVLYFDFWRVLCVILIIITHADEVYVSWNVLGVQQWVLPFLTLISGTLYAQSRQRLLDYNVRLLTYFSIGVILNGAAAMAAGVKWYGRQFPDAVMFQISFAILFMGGATVAAPLKRQLASDEGPRHARLNAILYGLILVTLLVAQVVLWRHGVTSLDQTIRVCGEVFATALLAASLLPLLPTKHRGLAGWALAGWIFGTRILHREPRPGSEIHYVDLYVWACFVHEVPLLEQAALGRAMARSWPAWVVACGLLLKPGQFGRMDQQPFETIGLRFRHYIPEFVAVVAFTAIPSGGPHATLPILESLSQHVVWMNRWALFAFVSHKAVYYLWPPLPTGLAMVLSTMPLFWWTCGSGAAVPTPQAQVIQVEPGV